MEERERSAASGRWGRIQVTLFAALSVALVLVLLSGPVPTPRARRAAPGPASPPVASTPAVLPAGGPAVPVRLAIPSVGVDAAVERVGVTSTGAMGVPANVDDAAWYENGPVPGAGGDAVIDGHLDWYSGPAVFWNLHQAKVGSTITVTLSSGTDRTFQVTALNSYPYTDEPAGLFATSGPPTLSLITCAGSWDAGREIYSRRLVVTAVPVAQATGAA